MTNEDIIDGLTGALQQLGHIEPFRGSLAAAVERLRNDHTPATADWLASLHLPCLELQPVSDLSRQLHPAGSQPREWYLETGTLQFEVAFVELEDRRLLVDISTFGDGLRVVMHPTRRQVLTVIEMFVERDEDG